MVGAVSQPCPHVSPRDGKSKYSLLLLIAALSVVDPRDERGYVAPFDHMWAPKMVGGK